MIHIVFNQPDIAVLQQVIALDNTLEGTILQIKDDYAVGPLINCYQDDGIAMRKAWWQMVVEGGDYANINDNEVNDEATFIEIKNALEQNTAEILWLWVAQNKHDVSGYYWLMSRLKDWQGSIQILYLNNLPFINEKGHLFYPEWISQIQPSEFLKAKKLARVITPSEFEIDPDEWLKICNENKYVRLLEGGKKLTQANVDFYDEALINYITKDFQKASKIITTFLNKEKVTTGDAFLLWRLKQIVANTNYETQGVVGKMKDFEIIAV